MAGFLFFISVEIFQLKEFFGKFYETNKAV